MNVSFISLGCDKNRVNTEQMMALCLQAGHTVQEDCSGSDVVVINTCGFIDSAKSEAIDTILAAAELKAAGEVGKILVTGCLSQRYQADILEELPEIDGIMGTGCFGDIVTALEQVVNGQECRHFADINGPVEELPRVISTPMHYAYLRIAEGCSNRCAYCIIPALRGKYRSRRMEDILTEAKALADGGVQECIVIAQDITRYGIDLYQEKKLPELLRELCKIEGLHWIRVHYVYPDEIDDELIDVIASEPKIVKYLDIPIQHCNDKILSTMHRRGDKKLIVDLFAKLRARIPGLVIRTSLIAGLPGEGEEEFQELCQFLRDEKMERVGAFVFSPEEGTPAATMDHVEEEVAKERAETLEMIQSQIMDEYNAAQIGKTMEVLVDGYDEEQEQFYGRTYADSPDIDGRVWIASEEPLHEGDFVNVTIDGCIDGDLAGYVAEETV